MIIKEHTFTAAQVNVWLNMAQREVQKLLAQAEVRVVHETS